LNAAQRFILNSEDIMSSDHDPDDGYHLYKPVHFTTAHKWVKDGYPHDTGLWVDTNWNGTRIIRYAKDDPNGY
jgi:predicted nicotinamide N-methyase